MRKFAFYVIVVFAAGLSLYSCKKNKSSGPASSFTPLLPASSGWQKVGTVKYTYTTVGFSGYNKMTPEELQKVGDELHILYSEDYQLSGVIGRDFYKGHLKPGTNDTAAITKLVMGSGTNRDTYSGLFQQRLVPGTADAIVLKYFTNPSPYGYLGILNEAGTMLSSHFVGHPSLQTKIYSNGDVSSGAIDYSDYAEMDFYNKATNTWTYVKGTSHDTTTLVNYTPFRLPDGTLCAFNVTYKSGKTYLSIANPSGATYPTPLYHSLFLQEMPGLAYDYFAERGPYLVASCQDENTFTIVIGKGTQTTNYPTKLYAYKWTKNELSFTTLYTEVTLTEAEGTAFNSPATHCLPDGTAYRWNLSLDALSGNVLTADATGVHRYGQITLPTNTGIGAVTYIDGGYYGVAYPYSDQFDTDHKLRMDIVKLIK